METTLLKDSFIKLFRNNFIFILVMFIFLGIIRTLGLAGENESLVVLGFLIMWVIPFIFIKKEGRKKIGIKKPASWFWILFSFLLGIISAGIIYVTGYFLYGTGTENWAMTVMGDYMADGEALIPAVFAVVTFMMMLFSPIGEELFFRGIIQEILDEKLSGYSKAALGSSLAFALIHIPHHGIVFSGQSFSEILIPVFLWTVFMFLVSLLFLFARKKSGSILGAIVCHSGYLLGMNLFIYHVLLDKV